MPAQIIGGDLVDSTHDYLIRQCSCVSTHGRGLSTVPKEMASRPCRPRPLNIGPARCRTCAQANTPADLLDLATGAGRTSAALAPAVRGIEHHGARRTQRDL